VTYPEISPETQAVLLLCGHFAPREAVSPLNLLELNRLLLILGASQKKVTDLLDGWVAGTYRRALAAAARG
jgi:hypothetical protein